MNIKVKSGPVLSAILIAILTFSFTTAAVAANPPCGCTIYENTTLDAPMVCPAGVNGINIGKDNIVLDGAGYSITGTGTGYGIFLSGRTGVTIKNCVVTKFSNGIRLASSPNNTLTGNTASSNTNSGIYLLSSSNNTLEGNTADNNTYYGIYLYSSTLNTLTGNPVSNNKFAGIYLYESSSNNTLEGNTASNNFCGINLCWLSNDNTITNNNITASSTLGAFGILFQTGSNNNTINKNKITYNNTNPNKPGIVGIKVVCDSSMYLLGSSGNTITGNIITMNQLNPSKWSQGIRIGERSNNTTILNNNITVNGGALSASIYLFSSSNNRIMDNSLTTSGSSGYGVYLSAGTGVYLSEGSNYNTFSGNNISAVGNSGVGIRLASSSNNTLEGNTVNSSSAPSINLNLSPSNDIYKNNIIGTFLPKVSSDAAVELSYGGSGNFWGRTTAPYFTAGTDSNRADVVDSYPYSALNGWLDKTPPSISITGVEDGKCYGTAVTPLISITDANLTTSSITLNGSPFTSGTSISAEGNYTLNVTAADREGNTAAKSVSFTICAPITGNPEVDAAMCVIDNKYTDPETGLATHGTYVSAVTNKVVEMRQAGKLTKDQGGAIVKKAAQSSVNMP